MLSDFRYSYGQFKVSISEITLTGDDVVSFLQAQCTYDVHQIHPNSFQLISFLDPQGRVEFYAWLMNLETHFKLLIPSLLIERSIGRLNKFLISEDVMISDPLEKDYFFIIGPDAYSFADKGCKGVLFEESCFILATQNPDLKSIPTEDIEKWRGLTGWPGFDGSDYKFEILNNLNETTTTTAQPPTGSTTTKPPVINIPNKTGCIELVFHFFFLQRLHQK
jgi:hypothetical protein